ncbi:DUF502 domain-containing protein [Anaerobacillus isosaccharinicus]|uniref:DUF502 domain-containing protein n=1 Tax=Anaerobacillus isosaccharinicus TaxID=1532552 RepID=A0A1S2LS02_9BACI|nr:DUF502 domain-containing protein [Anaerobacillus isosaccharinicus]MBA5585504.1 DUF502 domain-containing protein [Anaerobacillus isosaccharinicus]QOY36182.1 DUF502 domain-containing protein [Anaerobacillus isosaccharinicus]
MWKTFQKNIIAGFITLLPAIVTIYIIQLLFSIIDRFLGQFLSDVLKALRIIRIDEGTIYFLGVYTPFSERIIGIGFILTVVIISVIGSYRRKGKKQHVFDRVDHFFRKIPVANYIYSSVEQMINAFTQERSSFKKVVMIEYPRKGVYTLGFLTGESKGEVQRRTNKNCINVFLPTTPNPTSGWLVLVPEEDVTILDMSVEQGLKFIISGGVVVPPDRADMLLKEKELEEQRFRKEFVVKVKSRKED